MALRRGLLISLLCLPAFVYSQYVVEVQIVDLLVSVTDNRGDYVKHLVAEDFLVFEDGRQQEVVGIEMEREPFSIGILLDTSSSMRSHFRMTERATIDFLHSLGKQDEYFLMTFDDRIVLQKELSLASGGFEEAWTDLDYGQGTRLYDAVGSAVQKLQQASYPRRALFILSDGMNTRGAGSLAGAIAAAQRHKVLVYSLVFENMETDLQALRALSESTGGTYFVLFDKFPRLRAAYEKIAEDLANRFTLFYRSTSDYAEKEKPAIEVRMKSPGWKVRHQKTYYAPLP